MTSPAASAADARDLAPDLATVASLLRTAFIDGFEKGRAAAVPGVLRDATRELWQSERNRLGFGELTPSEAKLGSDGLLARITIIEAALKGLGE
jgi:hypothetical protein